MALRALLLAVLALLLPAFPASADDLRPGYLELTQQDAATWKLVWKAPVLGGLATRAQPLLPDFCTLAPGDTRLVGAAVIATGTYTCTAPLDGQVIGLKGMETSMTDALLRVAPLGRPVQATRLTYDSPTAEVMAVPDRWQVAQTYLALGVIHILEGYDHLLFVVALVLLLGRLGPVVKAATAFTVAHSITLVGTSLGLIGLAQQPVEAVIALSLIFLAVEIAKQRDGQPRLSERLPWVIAFLFGLVHGFGFAGALREIGLPETDVPLALLTFNLGVELGQLVIVAGCLAVLTLIRRTAPTALRPATVAATYGIGIVSSFWFIERMLA
ncbi:HupE/UreJ family protein [Novosphingobium sp.]|uniref:HupE/UreJ family protein n=1 Tax=Novosphingobium sp. TaxID=1874826 RepID=UPI0027357E65|nr:HupE/UreJ family protein [Novosphingobium sp.]MDP3907084.1 HupE/UreJ family protein [Novosphingobium sp.]